MRYIAIWTDFNNCSRTFKAWGEGTERGAKVDGGSCESEGVGRVDGNEVDFDEELVFGGDGEVEVFDLKRFTVFEEADGFIGF